MRFYPRFAIPVATVMGLSFSPNLARADQVVVNYTDYVTQPTGPNGGSLCTPDNTQCIQGAFNQYGEYQLFYAFYNGDPIVDYIGRSTGSNNFIGVIRSLSSNTVKCFSNGGQLCQAPSNANFFPESMYSQDLLNVATPQDDSAASNSDGTPSGLIPGSKEITGQQQFEVNIMDMATCRQSYSGYVGVDVSAVFIRQFPFGGNVGMQDTLVIQEIETGFNGNTMNPYPDHIERYYYVNGFGRVREATAGWSNQTHLFTNTQSNNAYRTIVHPPIGLQPPTNSCPQGSIPYN